MNEQLSMRGVEMPAAISYSLLAALVRHLPLEESITKMENIGISSIHYDIADELVTLPAELSHQLRKNSDLAFDYHIAQNDPQDAIRTISLRQNDYVCAHVESQVDWSYLVRRSKDSGASFGIGLNVSTDWTELVPKVDAYDPDFVLVMAAEAGRSGGSFDFKTLEKIHRIRDRYSDLRIHVDGGIDDLAAASLKGLGVELLVSGSYIHSGAEAKDRLAFLRGMPDNPELRSLLGEKLPQVQESAKWDEIVQALEYGEIGCVAVISGSSKYVGIITDHDIRVFIAQGNQISECIAGNICNRKSFTAAPDEDFWNFMLRMQKNKSMHTVVPLVDQSSKLIGILRTQDVLFRQSSQREL